MDKIKPKVRKKSAVVQPDGSVLLTVLGTFWTLRTHSKNTITKASKQMFAKSCKLLTGFFLEETILQLRTSSSFNFVKSQ